MAGNGAYRTYGGGARKLGTVSLRMRRASKNEHAPSVASQREYLRQALPAVYQDNDFGVRFVERSSRSSTRSSRHRCCRRTSIRARSGGHARVLANWLGLEVDEAWPIERKRELVGGDEPRRHGTREGLELTLKIAFPEHPLRVEDSGASRGRQEARPRKADKSGAGFVVYCDAPLDEHELGAVSRLIEQVKPVNVTLPVASEGREEHWWGLDGTRLPEVRPEPGRRRLRAVRRVRPLGASRASDRRCQRLRPCRPPLPRAAQAPPESAPVAAAASASRAARTPGLLRL